MGRAERRERLVDLQATTEDVSAVDNQDVVALRLLRKEELVGQLRVLEQEPVVSGHEDVGGVGVRGLLHQVDKVAECILHGLEYLPLGSRLVACSVDSVVVEVQHPVVLEELAPFLGAECFEVFGLEGGAADRLQDLRARVSAVGGLAVS